MKQVHLTENRPLVTKDNINTRAFPLGDADSLHLKSVSGKNKVLDVVYWLDVEKSKRYQPTIQNTFCNIYAYDVCYLMNVYLPRVWWTPQSLKDIQNSLTPAVIYARTVSEVSANSLFRWLKTWGGKFGWTQIDISAAQQAANDGKVVVIAARHKIESKSGHITIVVPGTKEGILQSQAGRKNRSTFQSFWYNGEQFAEWGVWAN